MAVEAIGGVGSTQQGATAPASLVSQDEFLRILLTQLTLQDPLKPLDNQEFLAQLAQFTSLEQQRQTTQQLETSVAIAASNQAVSLVGRTVDVAAADGPTSGQVTAVLFQNGQPALTVRLQSGAFLTDVTLAQISGVR